MFNPLEYKHDIAGRPLKYMIKRFEPGDEFFPYALVGMITAAVNLAPAATLIQMGSRGDLLYQGITMGKKPWDLTFHYMATASRAERIGGAVGGRIGGRSMLELARYGTPFSKGTQKAWQKAGAKAGVKLGARIGGRLIPGVGWALLAYDVYDIAYNRSLWGFDF